MSLLSSPASAVCKLRIFGLSIFTLSVFALSACQQAAWKAGANADDLKRDEQVCRTQTADDAAIRQCLRNKGWTVTEPDPIDNNAAALTATAGVVQAAPANAALPAAISSNTNVPTTNVPAITATATKPASPNPLQQQSIQTWWKAGAQAADFNADENICLTQLGTQHTPNYEQHLYTVAMINCLRGHGWSAGHDPVYTPLR